MRLTWEQLGRPTREGVYPVAYGGRTIYVTVSERLIAAAAERGGNPTVRLSAKHSSVKDDENYYTALRFV
ncbi:MAG: hypothetical protein ABFE01_21200 [Phycisphaerales bacterium]